MNLIFISVIFWNMNVQIIFSIKLFAAVPTRVNKTVGKMNVFNVFHQIPFLERSFLA